MRQRSMTPRRYSHMSPYKEVLEISFFPTAGRVAYQICASEGAVLWPLSEAMCATMHKSLRSKSETGTSEYHARPSVSHRRSHEEGYKNTLARLVIKC